MFDLLTPDQCNELVSEAVKVPVADARSWIMRELAEFEQRNGMSTRDMRAQVVAGTLAETEEICTWLITDNRRARLEAPHRP